MTKCAFHQLDVFTAEALRGNPLAVVHGADDVSEETMAALASWTNLSETTFLLTPQNPEADYRLRIFTPGGELPFAGHPTLGSCYSWLANGGSPKNSEFVVQECEIGLVKIRRDGERLYFAAPELRRSGPIDEETLATYCDILQIKREAILYHQWVDNGPGWGAIMLASASEVLAIQPCFELMEELAIGVVAASPKGADTDFEVRAFIPSMGVPEDPVTGSLNAGLARWLIDERLAPPNYIVAQGTALNRSGRVYVTRRDDGVWIGGDVTPCISGEISLS